MHDLLYAPVDGLAWGLWAIATVIGLYTVLIVTLVLFLGIFDKASTYYVVTTGSIAAMVGIGGYVVDNAPQLMRNDLSDQLVVYFIGVLVVIGMSWVMNRQDTSTPRGWMAYIVETTFGWAVITKLAVAVAAYWAVPHFTVAPMTRNQRGWAYVADVGQTFAALLTWMTLLAIVTYGVLWLIERARRNEMPQATTENGDDTAAYAAPATHLPDWSEADETRLRLLEGGETTE